VDMNERQIALYVLECLREELGSAHLRNGSQVFLVSDVRQYIYERIDLLRTNTIVTDRWHGNGNGPGRHIGKSSSHDAKGNS
jgi:hypothetical protein